MTFLEAFEKIKKKLNDADTSALGDFLAVQVNLTDDDCGGAFYIEFKNGVFAVEPYDYIDRSASITTSRADFNKIISRTLNFENAIADSKVFVDGDVQKAMLVTTLIKKTPKKASAKKVAAKKPTAKKTAKSVKSKEEKAEAKTTKQIDKNAKKASDKKTK